MVKSAPCRRHGPLDSVGYGSGPGGGAVMWAGPPPLRRGLFTSGPGLQSARCTRCTGTAAPIGNSESGASRTFRHTRTISRLVYWCCHLHAKKHTRINSRRRQSTVLPLMTITLGSAKELECGHGYATYLSSNSPSRDLAHLVMAP